MSILNSFKSYSLTEQVSIAPLVVFRFIFGIMMALSGIRFLLNGWVYDLYTYPPFHFKYFGFEWISVPSESATYLLFGLMICCAVFIALGFLYRLSAIGFFLSFTYIELLDKTTYLNHYYFISLVAGILIFLPAAKNYSIDSLITPSKRQWHVSRWTIDILKFQLGLVYVMAGIAKIHPDWLFEAMPLSNWLKHHIDMPVIGGLLKYKATAYFFSWFGMLYDLLIPLFLLLPKTRKLAYLAVVIFHVVTAYLFPIGMFPYIMIASTAIFFSSDFHELLLFPIRGKFGYPSIKRKAKKLIVLPYLLGIYLIVQLLIPFRYLLYPGNLFWTEQGYRFSWRVMLMEKTGYSQFKLTDGDTGNSMLIDNSDFLTPFQEKMMSTQPDMILEYAHYLRDRFKDSTVTSNNASIHFNIPEVRANVYTRLNGRSGQLINDTVNLAAQKKGFHHKTWILPMPK